MFLALHITLDEWCEYFCDLLDGCRWVAVELETVDKSVIENSMLTIVSLRGTRPWSVGRMGAGWT